MSSKIVSETAEQVRPFAWRTVALSGESLDRRRVAMELRPGMAPDPAHPLQTRIAELELEMTKRVGEARETGYSEGEAAGKAQGEDEVRAAVFEMPRGNLDASIDSQLREIERGLVDRFQRP